MGHIKDQMATNLGLTKRRAKKAPQPYDSFSRAELWKALEELRADLRAAQAKTNLLARDLRNAKHAAFAERAYEIRGILARYSNPSTATRHEALRDWGIEKE